MKFRALNFDYHAEATLRMEQRRQQAMLRGDDDESSQPSLFRLLVQAGSYERDKKEAPAAKPHERQKNWTTAAATKEEQSMIFSPFSVMVDELSFTRNSVDDEKLRIICSEKDMVVSNDACTSPAFNDKEDMEEVRFDHAGMEWRILFLKNNADDIIADMTLALDLRRICPSER